MTFDPRLPTSKLPFVLYPQQIKFIKWLDKMLSLARKGEKINALIDKPRDVGFTFVLMGWILHHWLFDDFVVRVGSWKEEYVDKQGETDTLFFKADFILENLPTWMQPKGWEKVRAYMIL